MIFKKPQKFFFYPGQYLEIILPIKNDQRGNSRNFTISSSPTERYLMITTKIGVSPFKKYLELLKVGDRVESSHPAGTFTLDETEPAIFIAGGIGITPFRSMIKYAVTNEQVLSSGNKIKTPITLIYSNSDNNFLFKKELKKWKKNLSNLTIIYHNSSQNGRLTKLYPIPYLSEGKASSAYTLNPIYYLAGPPQFVDDMEKILFDLGVDQVNIRYDRFDGY